MAGDGFYQTQMMGVGAEILDRKNELSKVL
jgi:hypothetical protein